METTTSTSIVIRERKLKTNLNGKLSCRFFVHIDRAGANGIPESRLDKTIYKFITLDKSHPEVSAKIIDACRQPLNEISSAFTLMSHSMQREEFINKVLTEVPGATLETEMVTYFYQAISE